MALPRPRVDHSYRTESVDLQPYGNTISVTSVSDNPFEDDQEAEIFTQQSGGMAGPDPRMRSKAVMHKGTAVKTRQHHAGVARVYKTNGAANRQGFMPGFGGFAGLGADGPTPPAAFIPNPNGPGFIMAPDQSDQMAALTVQQDAAAQGPPSGVWGALTSLFSSAPATAAAIEAARRGPAAPGMPPAGMPPPPKAGGLMKDLPWILGAVGVIGAAALIFGKKGAAAPATNPRRRRHRR